jgi:hypothetical protein
MTFRNRPKNRNISPAWTPFFCRCPCATPVCPKIGLHPDCRAILSLLISGSRCAECEEATRPPVKSDTSVPRLYSCQLISLYRIGDHLSGIGSETIRLSGSIGLGQPPDTESTPFLLNMIFMFPANIVEPCLSLYSLLKIALRHSC